MPLLRALVPAALFAFSDWNSTSASNSVLIFSITYFTEVNNYLCQVQKSGFFKRYKSNKDPLLSR